VLDAPGAGAAARELSAVKEAVKGRDAKIRSSRDFEKIAPVDGGL